MGWVYARLGWGWMKGKGGEIYEMYLCEIDMYVSEKQKEGLFAFSVVAPCPRREAGSHNHDRVTP